MARVAALLALVFVLAAPLSAQAQQAGALPERLVTISRNLDLPGNDLRPLFDSNLTACDAACRADPECVAFTFNSRSNACFPKSAIGQATPFDGALSGIVRAVDPDRRYDADRRARTLDFLDRTDLVAAFEQAEDIGLVHFAGQTPADQWRAGAAQRLDNGNLSGAIQMLGAAVALTDDAADWTAYAAALMQTDPDTTTERRTLRTRALHAAVNATLRAEPGEASANALETLATALEDRGRGWDAARAARRALAEAETPARQAAVDRLIGLYGFRVTDTRVDVEADFPRICATFSEPLAAGGVAYGDFLQSTNANLAVEADGRQLCLSGVQHGQRYEFTLRAGLPAASGEVLNAPVTLRQYVRDRAPSVRFAGRAYVLPASAGGTIPVVAVNTDTVDLRLFHVSDRNILRSIQDRYFGRPLAEWQVDRFADEIGEAVWSGSANVAQDPNRAVTTRVPIAEVLEGRAPGLYALEARVGGAGNSEGGATQWFLVSDLGISAASGPDGVHVIVRSLATTEAHAGVTLDLISESNRVLASAQTDADGYARFVPGVAAGTGGAAPALLTARLGDTDLAFLSLREAEFDLSDRGVAGREPAGAIDMFLTTDRGAYRAGEVIHVTALARDARAAALADLPLTAILTRADGVEYTREVISDIGAGGYVFSLPLGPDVPRGTWRLAIHADPEAVPLAQTRLLVEDFLPERLDLAIDLPARAFGASATVLVDFRARYLYGAPAEGLSVSGRMALRPTFTLPDLPGYRFGRHDAPPEPQFGTFGPLLTNNQGRTAGGLRFPRFEGSGHPGTMTVTAELTDTSGRPVERQETVTIYPEGPAIGIRPLFDGTLPEGSEAPFDLIAFGASGIEAQWTLNRVERRYQWYRQGGNWSWEPITTRQRIATGDVQLSSETPARLSVPVDWGTYELRVESSDGGFTVTSIDFSAGWFARDDGGDTPDALDIALDAERYRTGDTAVLRIVPRHGGLAMVQVISDRLVDQQFIDIGDGAIEVPLPVTEDWGAGAYVTVSLIRPLETVSGPVPARAIGVAHAAVDPGPRALEVALDTPEQMRPNGPLDVTLRVDGAAPGETVHATISAVDLGILNLTGFQAPDPLGHYFGQRRLGMAFRDVYGRLIDSRDGAEGRIRQGGDAGPGMRAQADPPTQDLVALFSGPVTIGEDGTARIRFDVPAFNGTLRVMATAWSPTAVGQASTDVIVRDPVVITAAAPRFLAPGDSAGILFEFALADGDPGEIALSLADDPDFRVMGSLPETLPLDVGRPAQVLLPLQVGWDAGEAVDIALTATRADGEVLRHQLSIPIRVNDPTVAETTRLTLAPGQTFTLDAAATAGFRPDTTRVTLSGGPLARFDAAGLLQRLDGYPYGCTEQITSRALPLLYLSSIAELMDLGTAQDLSDRIDAAIRDVLINQSANGSFGLWRAGSGDLWLNAYVTDFLSRARAEGFDVPARPFQSALDSLANAVATHPDFEAGGEGLAYALMVLAREGQASMGDLRYYADVKAAEFATPLALGQLGAALAMYGDQARADAMFVAGFARLTLPGTDQPPRVWRSDYGSAARDAAGLVALAAGSASPAIDVAAYATRVGERFGTEASTQEAVWTLLAAQALIDTPSGAGLTLDGAPVNGPLVQVYDAEQALTRVIENVGPVDQTLTLTRFGVPEGQTEAFGTGYRIERSYRRLDGTPVEAGSIRQGTRLIVVLEVQVLDAPDGRLMIDDPLPAGLEIENPNLLRSADVEGLSDGLFLSSPEHAEFRADRFLAAVDLRGETETIRLAYMVRAVTVGDFAHPAASVVDMYRPTYRAQTASARMTVLR